MAIRLEPGTYVVAVSGGVDSVVLLDILRKNSEYNLFVAHFDHGIRDDSAEDEAFVKGLANKYTLPFESKREELGRGTSEEKARERRYDFLRSIAAKYNAKIVTAHHADDAVETIAINLVRGTGWRGLAVLDSDIVRPLLDMSKADILSYASKNNLTWREDSTNASDVYLRNRLRHKIKKLESDQKRQLLALRTQQLELKQNIQKEVAKIVGESPRFSRYMFIHCDPKTAIECLRIIADGLLTRPQLERALLAIKTNQAGTKFEAGAGVCFRFTTRNFEVELIK